MNALEAAASRVADMHVALQAEAERRAFNDGVDKACEVISEWLSEGRDESSLFDKLGDLKQWMR